MILLRKEHQSVILVEVDQRINIREGRGRSIEDRGDEDGKTNRT